MPSGVMAQNIALLIHDGRENSKHNAAVGGRFMCHHTSHLLLWEESSYSKLVGMDAIEIDTRPTDAGFPVPPMRFQDVVNAIKKENQGTSSSSVKLGPSSLFLELPHRELGGKLTPWEEVLSISALCKKEGIKFHCDGARIFEASAGYGKSLKELADPFDSVYISFYKGLGSISGAMLMGSTEFCDEARIWLRRFGGNLYSLLPYAVSCWAGYNRHALCTDTIGPHGNSLTFEQKFEKLQEVTKKIESETDFSRIGSFDPARPQTNMIHVYIKKPYANCIEARDKVAKSTGFNMFTRLKEIPESDAAFKAGFRAKFEWTIGEANGSINDEVFVQVWKEFCSS
jgi:threonine aldolase